MKFDEFVNAITFKLIKPETPITGSIQRIDSILSKTLDFSLESFNTKFPINNTTIKHDFKELCRIPKMSTLALGAIINYGVNQLPPDQAFVNVGVWNGFTFLSGLLNNPEKICIGIDNFSQFGGPKDEFLLRYNNMKSKNHHFFDMDYEQYFLNSHTKKIGFYL